MTDVSKTHRVPLHELEPLATGYAQVIFCIDDDRFVTDFTVTVTWLRPRPRM